MALAPCASAQTAARWPREIKTAGGYVITLYQPQPEKFAGQRLTARSAISIKEPSKPDPVFGTAWFSSLVDTDRDATAEREQKSLLDLKNDPPRIVFSDQVAILLLFDEPPQTARSTAPNSSA